MLKVTFTGFTFQKRTEEEEFGENTRVYVRIENEELLQLDQYFEEQATFRRLPVSLICEGLVEFLTKRCDFNKGDVGNIRFSENAGCSCGCSPGFILSSPLEINGQSVDLWVDGKAEEVEEKRGGRRRVYLSPDEATHTDKLFNIRFDGCGVGDIEDGIPDDVTWIVVEDDEDGMTIAVETDTITDYASDPNEFVAYLTGPGRLPDGLLVTFLAMVPNGWARDVDPRKAIRSARRQVGLKGKTKYVVYRSTDLEAYVDSYGRIWSDPKATVVKVDETGGVFEKTRC